MTSTLYFSTSRNIEYAYLQYACVQREKKTTKNTRMKRTYVLDASENLGSARRTSGYLMTARVFTKWTQQMNETGSMAIPSALRIEII